MTWTRLNVIVEGQTEEEFVNEVLGPHLLQFHVLVVARAVSHVRRRVVTIQGNLLERRKVVCGRGGLGNFSDLRDDIHRWTREDHSTEARFTTMVDLYAYPTDSPHSDEAQRLPPYEKVRLLEQGLAESVNDWRFIPYVQLHEFETMLYADLSKWPSYFLGQQNAVNALASSVDSFNNIELINDDERTAPSKRILEYLPEYDKVFAGNILAMEIGLPAMRTKCAHFNAWLTSLENLR